MSVINATQAKSGTIVTSGPIGRLVGWIEHLFGHVEERIARTAISAASTVAAHGEPSRGNDGELEMTADFGWDKTAGWDRRKKAGWSPHGDGGMR
jgi:hypothetical protein